MEIVLGILSVVVVVVMALWVVAGVVRLMARGARPHARRRSLNRREIDRVSEAWRRQRDHDDREDGA